MASGLVVKVKIKDSVNEFEQGFNVAGDFAEALDKKMDELIKKACERAKGNARKTVMAKDL